MCVIPALITCFITLIFSHLMARVERGVRLRCGRNLSEEDQSEEEKQFSKFLIPTFSLEMIFRQSLMPSHILA